MPLTITDFVEQVDGLTVEDISTKNRKRINDALAGLTGGPGGSTSPVNDDAILVSKTLDGRAGFNSIQDAIDGTDAKNGASGASSGDTIFVEAGTYPESVTIKTSGLTLKGNGNPTIVGDGVNTGSQPHAAIHVNDGSGPVRNVTIDGFTVQNPDGKYGIFAGTGSTNKDPDGIGGLVVRDNVVENVSTNSTGGALTGGPAGIGIRGDYGTDGNPGIEIDSNVVRNVQNDGGPEPVGITLKSFTGDAGFGKDSNGADVTDQSSPPATGTKILNNKISNIISTAGGYATKGISVSGEFEDIDVINNSITGIESPGSTALAITFSENGGSYSTNQYDIDDDGSGERIGPRNFTIEKNEIDSFNADDPRSLYIGGYEDLGTHIVKNNNFLDTGAVVARFAGDQPGYQIGDGDALDVQKNYWGASDGPSGEDGAGGSGAPAVTLGDDGSGNASGKVLADEPASDSTGFQQSAIGNAGSSL